MFKGITFYCEKVSHGWFVRYGLLVGLCFGLVCLHGVRPAWALDQRSLSVAPTKTELILEPGQSWTGSVGFAIDIPDQVFLSFRVMDFKALDESESGVPYFFEPLPNQTRGILSRWIKIQAVDQSEIVPLDFFQIPVTISIPQNADPGGYYAAVIFDTVPISDLDDASGSATASSVGSLFLVTVPGEIDEQAELVEFYSQQDVYPNPPLDFVTRVLNQGTLHIRPEGEIIVKNSFGFEVMRLPVNQENGNILPDSIRKFDSSAGNSRILFSIGSFDFVVGRPLMMGRYTATLELWYGSDQRFLTARDVFWVLPWPVIILVWGGLIVFLFLTRRFHLAYMRWVWLQYKKLRWKSEGEIGVRD